MQLRRALAGFPLSCALISLATETISLAQERVSPDKRWEYQYSNGVGPQIVKAGTSEAVLDLSDALPSEKKDQWLISSCFWIDPMLAHLYHLDKIIC